MKLYKSYKNNNGQRENNSEDTFYCRTIDQKGVCACVCVGKVGGGASYVSKGAYRTVFKNLIRLKFNKRISHQISNSNVFEM